VKLPVPTALGYKAVSFYALLFGAFLAAPYANLFFLLLVFLTVLAVASVFWTHLNIAGVTAQLDELEPTPAGTGQPVRAVIDGGRRTRMALQLEFQLEGRKGNVTLPIGPVRGAMPVQGRLPALPRGLYKVRRVRVVSTWPLGVLRVARTVEAASELIVYPAPADVDEQRKGHAADVCGQRGADDGFLQPSSLREYREGDELRMVHWKATARRGQPVVQVWEGGANGRHEILLDRRTDEAGLDRALGLLSAAARNAREHKELIALYSQGLSATFGSEHRPWREFLAFLAGAQALPADGPPPPAVPPHVPRLGGVR